MDRAIAAYYAGRDPFGAQGDFTTAPEISQVFGECLGLWAAVQWQQMGAPTPVILAEIGPGRGTLMADALRAITEMVPAFRSALRPWLIETSPLLRAKQEHRLAGQGVQWASTLAALPPGPLLLLGNEFLDALPIRQFIWHNDRWCERHVQAGAFVDIPAPNLPAEGRPHPSSPPPGAPIAEGTIQEYGEAALHFVDLLAARLRTAGGAALFLDYGPAASAPGDSLQALSGHGRADPLGPAGSADLTAHVDFAALAARGQALGLQAHGPLPQGLFLQRLGLASRSAALAASAPQHGESLMHGAWRLTAPEAMGRLFKALCLCHAGPDDHGAPRRLPDPPGFEGV